jgi:hypothetical protein
MSQFGEDFGQKVDLTASIRNILRNYPEGTAIFKELIQNADDAGARVVKFCLDYRTHRAEKLADGALAQFQGPSLLVYNDAVFTKEDFQSIQRIGDSLKNHAADSRTKIGRFGIGFNAVYHWTELPSFISDHYLVMLDPQARFLPNVNPANPGKIVDWFANKSLLRTFKDQFEPYSIPEINWTKPFKGTLFRLPLRTPAQAESSFLSKRSLNIDQVNEVLQSLISEASSMILFLRNVEKVVIQVWMPDQAQPEEMYSCGINNSDKTLQMKRSYDDVLGKNRGQSLGKSSVLVQDFVLEINVTNRALNQHITEHWEVCTQFGGGEASRFAADPTTAHLKLVPLGGIAANIYRHDSNDVSALCNMRGSAYCFLPLPIITGLPVMVNGFFELSSNRRDIWQESVDMTGDGSVRANWNASLLRDILAPCYARLILKLRDKLGFTDTFQRFWPNWDLSYPWSLLGNNALKSLASQKVLASAQSAGQNACLSWISPIEAVVIPLAITNTTDKLELSRVLKHLGALIVTFHSDQLHEGLIRAGICTNLATAEFVRTLLRHSNQAISMDMCKFVVSYCMSDQKPFIATPALNQLTMLPLRNTAVGQLRTLTTSEKQSLDTLVGMGFPLQDSLASLIKFTFDVNQSWEFLTSPAAFTAKPSQGAQTSNRQGLNDWRAQSLYILPAAHDDLSVFAHANNIIIDHQALGAKENEILCHPDFQRYSNIRLFDATFLPDILAHILPKLCFDKRVVRMTDMTTDEQTHTAQFIPQLWRYIELNYAKVLPALYESVAIVPTLSFAELCPISRLSNIVSPSRGDAQLPAVVVEALKLLQIKILDTPMLNSALPLFPPAFWNYIHPPCVKGVLSALNFARRETTQKFTELAQNLSTEHKEALWVFVAQESRLALTGLFTSYNYSLSLE